MDSCSVVNNYWNISISFNVGSYFDKISTKYLLIALELVLEDLHLSVDRDFVILHITGSVLNFKDAIVGPTLQDFSVLLCAGSLV